MKSSTKTVLAGDACTNKPSRVSSSLIHYHLHLSSHSTHTCSPLHHQRFFFFLFHTTLHLTLQGFLPSSSTHWKISTSIPIVTRSLQGNSSTQRVDNYEKEKYSLRWRCWVVRRSRRGRSGDSKSHGGVDGKHLYSKHPKL